MRVLALLVLTACATTTTTTGPGAGLVGAWRAPAPEGAGACPMEVEVLADGTAELNYIDDDSDLELCMFARVPVREIAPDVVAFGDVATCRWERRGAKLALACEDHS